MGSSVGTKSIFATTCPSLSLTENVQLLSCMRQLDRPGSFVGAHPLAPHFNRDSGRIEKPSEI